MPGFNGTGPRGAGPMTGGGRGCCTDARSGFQGSFGGTDLGSRGGRGRGRCGGYGYGRQFAAQKSAASNMTPAADELNMLRAQADDMAQALEEIRTRMAELEKESDG